MSQKKEHNVEIFSYICNPLNKNLSVMKIDHIGIWCEDIERMKDFYTKYFACRVGEIYSNPAKKYSSYFLSFSSGGARVELMNRPDITEEPSRRGMIRGLAHLGLTVGSKYEVNELVERLRADGYTIARECRTTGDGYYEAIVLDPEGNRVEVCAE